jgi:hypothetical protein
MAERMRCACYHHDDEGAMKRCPNNAYWWVSTCGNNAWKPSCGIHLPDLLDHAWRNTVRLITEEERGE